MARVWVRAAVAVAAACALANCGEKETQTAQKTAVRYTVPPHLDRELNDVELDSLHQMKTTHGITRDEYWDGYGGVFANDEIEVWYPDGKVNSLQGMAMVKLVTSARERARGVFGAVPAERVVVVCTGDLNVYQAVTGRQWWHYSRIQGDTITIQAPIELHTRGLLAVVGPREYYEWVIGKLSKGNAPRWVEEGFASYLAREAPVLEELRMDIGEGPIAMSLKETESTLARETDRQMTRRAYYNAYRTVEQIVKQYGEPAMARFVVALADAKDANAASRIAFGTELSRVDEAGSAWAITE
jgi:hypothetical protein